jgi:multiple sugar transport system ATP-binding protein
MKAGVVQQIGKPQDVYDHPINLFVAKFLGTPPINVFSGRVQKNRLYIGDDAVLSISGVSDRDVLVGIRPEGFVLQEASRFPDLSCHLSRIEVMGRDISVVSSHPASQNPTIRSIIRAENEVNSSLDTVHFSLKPEKVFLFDSQSEEQIPFKSE